VKKVFMAATIVVLLVVSLFLPVRTGPLGQGPPPRPPGPTDEIPWADDDSYITLAALSTVEPDDTGLLTRSPGITYGPSQQSGEPADPTAKRAPRIQGGGHMAPAEIEAQDIISEDFEGHTMPPAGWTHIQTNPSETWEIFNLKPYSGDYYAHVLYDPTIEDQDEVLLSPSFTLDSGRVALWTFGSLYWCAGAPYDYCDLEVWFVNGSWDWGGGDDVYLGKTDGDWAGTFIWSYSTFDFSPYASGNPARIALRYVGKDGAEVSVDDIVIDSGGDEVFLPIILRNY